MMRPESPEAAWQELLAGNRRFASGALLHPHQAPDVRTELAEGQRPFAAILGCSDSRVPAEIIFDCGLGDLFVVRTAGQALAPAVYGSLEFAVMNLGVRLILVLGHTQCGAVGAVVQNLEAPGYLGELLALLKPAASRGAPGDAADPITAAVEENVRQGVLRLRALNPVLRPAVSQGLVFIRGAVYDLQTGQVREVI
jgi:carbonic anhydrase